MKNRKEGQREQEVERADLVSFTDDAFSLHLYLNKQALTKQYSFSAVASGAESELYIHLHTSYRLDQGDCLEEFRMFRQVS